MFLSNKPTFNHPSKPIKPRCSNIFKQNDSQIRDSILSIPNFINFPNYPDNLNNLINEVIPEENQNISRDNIFSEKQRINKTPTGSFATHTTQKKSIFENRIDRISSTMNRSFVVFEKQHYLDQNASFIRTNNLNDTEDEDFGNRSTFVKPQEIMSKTKAEICSLINLFEPKPKENSILLRKKSDNRISTELKCSNSNILPINIQLPKLDFSSSNFVNKLPTKSWIDAAFDSPKEKEAKFLENFEEDNEINNFNFPSQRDLMENITSNSPHFIQSKDKKSDISDDEDDFIYDGRSRQVFSFYNKNIQKANSKTINNNVDKNKIETISEHPQENILNSSNINNSNVVDNRNIIEKRINFVIDNKI